MFFVREYHVKREFIIKSTGKNEHAGQIILQSLDAPGSILAKIRS